MSETDPLISDNSTSNFTRQLFSNTNNTNNNFIWVIPAIEDEKTHKDRFFSIRLCYFVIFITSVSFTICISSMWPFLQIVIKIENNFNFILYLINKLFIFSPQIILRLT